MLHRQINCLINIYIYMFLYKFRCHKTMYLKLNIVRQRKKLKTNKVSIDKNKWNNILMQIERIKYFLKFSLLRIYKLN